MVMNKMILTGLPKQAATHRKMPSAARDHLKELRRKVDHPSAYTTFAMRKQMSEMRGSWHLRQVANGDRIQLTENIRRATEQNALKNEMSRIQGHQSTMNLPDHLKQRLSDVQRELARM